jgi:hypothetical protein
LNKIKLAKEILKDIERADCVFFACPGPNKPFKHMQTCFMCYSIIRMRRLVKYLERGKNGIHGNAKKT